MNVLKPVGWAGVLYVFLGAVVGCASTPVQDPAGMHVQPDVMTKAIRGQFDKQFPGWTVVPPPACGAAASPVTADIDSDTATDVALVVRTPGGQPQIVVAMPRVSGGPIVHDLGPLSAVPGATHIIVLPQGTAVREAGAVFDDYLSGPTFAAASCEKVIVAFAWSGGDFRQRIVMEF